MKNSRKRVITQMENHASATAEKGKKWQTIYKIFTQIFGYRSKPTVWALSKAITLLDGSIGLSEYAKTFTDGPWDEDIK